MPPLIGDVGRPRRLDLERDRLREHGRLTGGLGQDERCRARDAPRRDVLGGLAAGLQELSSGEQDGFATARIRGHGDHDPMRGRERDALPQGRPRRAVPSRDAVDEDAGRCAEVASDVEARAEGVGVYVKGVTVRVQATADRRPGGSVPARDVLDELDFRVEAAGEVQLLSAAVVVDGHGVDEIRSPAAAGNARPARAVPLGHAAPGIDPVVEHTAAGCIDRRSAAVVVDLEIERYVCEPPAEGRPARAVPARDPGCRNAPDADEVAADVQRFPRAVVVDEHAPQLSKGRDVADLLPRSTVPPNQGARGLAFGLREATAGVERFPTPVIEGGERVDLVVEPTS